MVKFVRFREAKKNFFLSKASITEDLANGEEKNYLLSHYTVSMTKIISVN